MTDYTELRRALLRLGLPVLGIEFDGHEGAGVFHTILLPQNPQLDVLPSPPHVLAWTPVVPLLTWEALFPLRQTLLDLANDLLQEWCDDWREDVGTYGILGIHVRTGRAVVYGYRRFVTHEDHSYVLAGLAPLEPATFLDLLSTRLHGATDAAG